MKTVRTTIEPGRDIEVSDEEYLDLQRQGLIQQKPATKPKPSPKSDVDTSKED